MCIVRKFEMEYDKIFFILFLLQRKKIINKLMIWNDNFNTNLYIQNKNIYDFIYIYKNKI